jgi:hypothetical protein
MSHDQNQHSTIRLGGLEQHGSTQIKLGSIVRWFNYMISSSVIAFFPPTFHRFLLTFLSFSKFSCPPSQFVVFNCSPPLLAQYFSRNFQEHEDAHNILNKDWR